MIHTWIDKYWYQKHVVRWGLYPFAWGYQAISVLRRAWLQRRQISYPVPLIVVGNLTVGGAGKTPLVIALVQAAQARGLKVGVVSRGYGASQNSTPRLVTAQDDPRHVGDEPLLIVQKTQVPVVIAKKRNAAVSYLLSHHPVDMIISDDGLQHYRMGRAIEIAVIDGQRGLGNGLCLPAGPLRERAKRLQQMDFVVVNGGGYCTDSYVMQVLPEPLVQLSSGILVTLEQLVQPVAAVAGIGNPQRFFALLQQMGLRYVPYIFADHHVFSRSELDLQEKIIVMTEKDAIKCRTFATESMYVLPIRSELSEAFWQAFWSHDKLQGLI